MVKLELSAMPPWIKVMNRETSVPYLFVRATDFSGLGADHMRMQLANHVAKSEEEELQVVGWNNKLKLEN